jgi:single-strand DNA-binding protein
MIRAAINGRLGGNPVQRATRTGKSMVTASVAVNVAKTGEEPVSEWISVAAFGVLAESLAQHTKGDVITAMGSLTRSAFTDRDGKERSSWSLLAESVLSARTARGDTRGRRAAQPARRPQRGIRQAAQGGPPLPADSVDDLYA